MSEYPHLCRECFEIGDDYDTEVLAGDLRVMLECPHCGRCWSVIYSSPDASVNRDMEVRR